MLQFGNDVIGQTLGENTKRDFLIDFLRPKSYHSIYFGTSSFKGRPVGALHSCNVTVAVPIVAPIVATTISSAVAVTAATTLRLWCRCCWSVVIDGSTTAWTHLRSGIWTLTF